MYQGYLFSPPVDIAAFGKLLTTGAGKIAEPARHMRSCSPLY